MSDPIDTLFDVYSDTPKGRDPDSQSPTLRRFHQALWSKRLPTGQSLALSVGHPKAYLYHRGGGGELFLSSDSIGHTYRSVKSMASIVAGVAQQEVDEFFRVCSTVGAYIVFPSQKVGNMMTINGARGTHARIRDRFDLTLECIRLHYLSRPSPLGATLDRYADFFALFGSFEGYVTFFLLQDAVLENGAAIDFFLPFDGFEASPLPSDVEAYRTYRDKVVAFIQSRNKRIEDAQTVSRDW